MLASSIEESDTTTSRVPWVHSTGGLGSSSGSHDQSQYLGDSALSSPRVPGAAPGQFDEVVASRLTTGLVDAPMAVLVQPFMAPAWGGVLFSADPLSGRADRMVLTAVPGSADETALQLAVLAGASPPALAEPAEQWQADAVDDPGPQEFEIIGEEDEREGGDRRLVDAVLLQSRGQRRADHRIGKAGRDAEEQGAERCRFGVGPDARRKPRAPARRLVRLCRHSQIPPPDWVRPYA